MEAVKALALVADSDSEKWGSRIECWSRLGGVLKYYLSVFYTHSLLTYINR
jgi:hypothetical protein